MDKKILIGVIVVIAVLVIVGVIMIIINSNNNSEKIKENNVSSNVTSAKKNQTNSVSTNITNTTDKVNTIATSTQTKTSDSIYSTGKHRAKIEVANYGTIELELDADVAPITVSNFAKLVNEGFYNGLTFHRIMSGFMIQGGDPNGNGSGGTNEKIKGEFSANGVQNSITHVRGTISMARAKAYDSASSQFFIVHKDSTFLDGNYAGFGKVTSGMEVVDKICEDVQAIDNNGTVLQENQPVITKIEMID